MNKKLMNITQPWGDFSNGFNSHVNAEFLMFKPEEN